MSNGEHEPDQNLDDFIDETCSCQRNIVFPDTFRNVRSVDVFFLRGSPNPTVLQRIGAWLVGMTLVGLGLVFLTLAARRRDEGHWIDFWIMIMISLAFVWLGTTTFRNGFPRRQKPTI